MLNAVRVARAQRPFSFSYSLPNHNIITLNPSSGIRFAQSVSGPEQPDEMDPKQGHESNKTSDTMSSFGEGYATRADEEGFGGTYGGNIYLRKDDEEKNVHGKDPAAEFDDSQGSEVKEKEKARNQSKV